MEEQLEKLYKGLGLVFNKGKEDFIKLLKKAIRKLLKKIFLIRCSQA
jgi:hypothetical protein